MKRAQDRQLNGAQFDDLSLRIQKKKYIHKTIDGWAIFSPSTV